MSKSLYFIDARVDHYQNIINRVSPNDTYFLVPSERNGLAEIARILSTHKNFDALHIISHGSMGNLYLGNILLTQENMASYKALLQYIGGSLSSDGSIFLDGYDISESNAGEFFIGALATLTGVDVAISPLSLLDGENVLEGHSSSVAITQLHLAYDSTLVNAIHETASPVAIDIQVNSIENSTFFDDTFSFHTLVSKHDSTHTSSLNSEDSFYISDPLNTYDTSLWMKSDGWSNGGVFANNWEGDQIVFNNGIMQLRLEEVNGTLVSGEYQSNEAYGHGYYEVSLKASGIAGTINGFFTYTGPSEGTPHDEIDVEIKGDNPTLMQVNYWTNGVEHPFVIDLGFDASIAFHTYGFSWQADKIEWYVDGQLVHTEDGSLGALPTHPGKIITNLWGTSGAGVWSSDYDVSNGDAVLEVTHINYSTDLTHIGTVNNDTLYGLSRSDFLDGGMGNDVLYGGLGNDTLKGGEGEDTFVFNTALNPTVNIDTILDFSSAKDTLILDDAIFQSLAGKTIVSDNLEIGAGVSTASETDNYLIYNTTSGALYYDADGSTIGGVDAVQIAQLGVDIHPTLVASDFAIL